MPRSLRILERCETCEVIQGIHNQIWACGVGQFGQFGRVGQVGQGGNLAHSAALRTCFGWGVHEKKVKYQKAKRQEAGDRRQETGDRISNIEHGISNIEGFGGEGGRLPRRFAPRNDGGARGEERFQISDLRFVGGGVAFAFRGDDPGGGG